MDKLAVPDQASTFLDLSQKWGMKADQVMFVVKSTIFRGDAAKATDADVIAFLMVCNKYELNPFLRQVHVFLGRQGGIFPIVGVDGWVSLVNRESRYRGVEFIDIPDEKGNLAAITTRMSVAGLDRPVEVTEYMAECKRDTEPWRKWPRRLLRHKSYIQCARIAFGLSGIYDEDEVARIAEAEAVITIDEPQTVEQAKAVLLPPSEPPQVIEEPPDIPPHTPTKTTSTIDTTHAPPSQPPPKGEETVSSERREEVIAHLQKLEIGDPFPPTDLTEIEAGLLLGLTQKSKINKVLDSMMVSRDQKRPML